MVTAIIAVDIRAVSARDYTKKIDVLEIEIKPIGMVTGCEDGRIINKLPIIVALDKDVLIHLPSGSNIGSGEIKRSPR